MSSRLARIVVVASLALASLPAQARFGKAGSTGTSASSSESSSPRSTGSGSTESGSAPATHAAVPVHSGQGRAPAHGVPPSSLGWGGRAWRHGYYSGWYVPRYGYGYGFYAGPPLVSQEPVAQESTGVRFAAGLEAMTYVNGEKGVTLGATAQLEGERWGLFAAGQSIAARSLEGPGVDLLPQAQLRLTYAFLSGRYGRLRGEVGADGVFAQDVTTFGPSAGLSGTLWLGGTVAVEGSVLVTPFPFWQLDYRAGVALGLGPVGLRAGWRTQVLEERDLTGDGLVHRDVFMGPYVGVSVAL